MNKSALFSLATICFQFMNFEPVNSQQFRLMDGFLKENKNCLNLVFLLKPTDISF